MVMNAISWSRGRGVLSCAAGSMLVLEKPDLSFEFDALFYEQTLQKKTIDDIDYPLSAEEIAEIEAWLLAQLQSPILVSGVDGDGNYLQLVPASMIVKSVTTPPPSNNGWRYDFAASESGIDHWVQLH
jgi:hypothetical protein